MKTTPGIETIEKENSKISPTVTQMSRSRYFKAKLSTPGPNGQRA
jgi:hypothetical protein